MKKKLLSVVLASSMVAGIVAGCGSSSSSAPAATEKAEEKATEAATEKAEETATEAAAETADEGKVFNIQCWNEEFKSRVTDHYPGYEKIDDTTGKIGDVTVNWQLLLHRITHIRITSTQFFLRTRAQPLMIR
jgi:hypothetical protein